MPDILVLNGPNLNLLGRREPSIYGAQTLDDIDQALLRLATANRLTLESRQSNAEHELIGYIHQARDEGVRYIVFNPGAYTHTSIALRDALLGVAIPFIEVHLSNVYRRETFRHHSYLSDIAAGVIAGLGPLGYLLALQAAIEHIQNES